MRMDPAYRKITVDEFLAIDFGTDKKLELVDGVIRMMTGGTVRHAAVAGNIYAFLRTRLRGSGCMPFNSDMGVRVGDADVRYPDVSVFCGRSWQERDASKTLSDPVVVIEVLSPTTSTTDQGSKLEEYRSIPSVETVVFVDPVNELTRTVQRLTPTSWRDDMFAQPHDVALPALGLTIPHGEMFARD